MFLRLWIVIIAHILQAFAGQALNKVLYIYDFEKKNQISQQFCEVGITIIPISYLRTLGLMNLHDVSQEVMGEIQIWEVTSFFR